MTNSIIFNHNFCESRLQDNEGPELLNSYSSLFIAIIPLICGIPNNFFLKNVSYMLIMNGFFSFYYHYYLTWFGKHLDEVTMILANYFGICGLIEMYDNSKYQNKINKINTAIMPVFICINTIPQFDYLFPTLFGLYVSYTVYLILDIADVYNYKKTVYSYLLYSLFGVTCWIISELYCSEVSKYGHVVWHILFPIGFYKILKIYDNLF